MKHSSQKSLDNICLIIIDQMRRDYVGYTTRCAELLPYHIDCDSLSIPTSTETMHANIATGLFPKDHKIVTKKNLSKLGKSMNQRQRGSLADIASYYGFRTILIGGKPETVEPFDYNQSLALGLSYKGPHFVVSGNNQSLVKEFKQQVEFEQYFDLARDYLDFKILELLSNMFKLQEPNKNLLITTLSSLDMIGHIYGPHSETVKAHLNRLDKTMAEIIEKNLPRTYFLLTGDHGCRKTTTYLVPQNESNPQAFAIYKEQNNIFRLLIERRLYSKDIKEISYDGGLLRIFKTDGKSLDERDIQLWSDYGLVLPTERAILKPSVSEIYKNSRNINLGNVVILANPEVSFCRLGWLSKPVQAKVKRGALILNTNDLPLGEHGSHHPADTNTILITNYDIGYSQMENTQIRPIIEEILDKNQRRNNPW